MNNEIRLSLPLKKEYLPIVRLTASAVANTFHFTLEEIEDIKLCVAEASMFCLGSEECREAELYFAPLDGGIEISICGVKKPEEDHMGIQIIQALMDEVEFGEHGMMMKKYLRVEEDGE